jgi:autoinducer 2 (AI-2) kinase
MERILRAFVDGAKNDAALQTFAAGKDVILRFSLTDLGLEFYLGFEDDAVVGDLGAPAVAAGVQLKMAADVLDGMLTGRINAMQFAMSGKLSFSGDTAKAMTLQHIQDDLNRLYSEAREEIGDPGDLSALSEVDDSAAAASVPVHAGDLRHELIDIMNELYAAQLITATGGNVSARIPGTDEVWITPSQLFKGDLRPEILVRINLEGEALDEGTRSPSSEQLMHCAVYKARPEVQAVVHAHAPHATILANAELPFLPISTEAAFFGELPRIPFIMPGTQALSDAVAEAIGNSWAILLQNHGLLVVGRSLRRAADMVEIIDRSCEVILGCYAVGKEPPTLPEETVEMLRKMGDLIA